MTREEAIEYNKNLREYMRITDKESECKFLKENYEALDMAIKALEQEPCGDAISRKSIKQKLQEHHDFFVNAYGGFSNLPRNDKSRVDEISSCIAMVVNEPPVTPQPKTGHWIEDENEMKVWCSECGEENDNCSKCCPNCGAKMIKSHESERGMSEISEVEIQTMSKEQNYLRGYSDGKSDTLDKIRAEILDEKEYAYADFEQYKIDYLGVDAEYVEDELPQDDFRYGMQRCVEIIDKYKAERNV